MPKTIQIRSTEYKSIAWSELKGYEFNTLKESKDRDVSKLKTSILENKFSDSFDIWDRYVIDGAGRWLALSELQKEGFEIPDLPCNFIEATNLKEAKKIVLLKNSTYGKISQASLADFTSIDFEIEELKELAESQFSLTALDFMIDSLEFTTDYKSLVAEKKPEKLSLRIATDNRSDFEDIKSDIQIMLEKYENVFLSVSSDLI